MSNSNPPLVGDSQVTDVQIRRIFLREEADEIQSLQRDAPEFGQHYPRHFDWLKMAINEVVAGNRFAFGVFKSAFSSNGEPTTSLAGSIILKKETYSHVMQLKNLYVRREERSKQYGRRLFEVVEQFCIKRGCSSIETEVPFDEHGTVNFLNLIGFFVQNLVESPYRKGDRIYRMYKPLPAKFTGDPFDLFRLSTWLFENHLGFRVARTELDGNGAGRFYFETLGEAEALQVRGLVYVCDELEPVSVAQISELQKAKSYPLIAVVARQVSAEARKQCEKGRILLYDEATLHRELGSAFPLGLPRLTREDVRGMIVRLNSKYEGPVLRSEGLRTYFKGGPVGKYLKAGDRVAFFVEESPNVAGGGVKGLCKVEDCAVGAPEEIWHQFADQNPLFPQEDFVSWSSDKAEVVAITFSEVEEIEAIPFAEVRKLVTSTTIDAESVGHSYLGEQDVMALLDRRKIERSPTVRIKKSRPRSSRGVLSPVSMRILFLAANPLTSTRLDLEEELRCLEIELRSVKFRTRIEITARHAVRADDLIRYVRSDKPNVIHFSGHGSSDGIELRADSGDIQVVDGASLTRFLKGRGIVLAVLNSCYSIDQANSLSMALDRVVGTTCAVGDEAARRFSVAFYRSLGEGLSVGEAFRDAGDAVALHGLADVFHSQGDLDFMFFGSSAAG